MAGVGKHIEEAVKALDQGQMKKALYLTDKRGAERQHAWVEEAARTCLADKDNKPVCDQAMKEARDKMQETITAPIDSTDLEDLEDFLTPKQEETVPEEVAEHVEVREKTDEELYLDCPECHVADAAVKFVGVCEDDCSGETCATLRPLIENQSTPPETWVKTMRELAAKEGCGQEAYKKILGELEDYLKEHPIKVEEVQNA